MAQTPAQAKLKNSRFVIIPTKFIYIHFLQTTFPLGSEDVSLCLPFTLTLFNSSGTLRHHLSQNWHFQFALLCCWPFCKSDQRVFICHFFSQGTPQSTDIRHQGFHRSLATALLPLLGEVGRWTRMVQNDYTHLLPLMATKTRLKHLTL